LSHPVDDLTNLTAIDADVPQLAVTKRYSAIFGMRRSGGRWRLQRSRSPGI
jgi:hypothetical protein